MCVAPCSRTICSSAVAGTSLLRATMRRASMLWSASSRWMACQGRLAEDVVRRVQVADPFRDGCLLQPAEAGLSRQALPRNYPTSHVFSVPCSASSAASSRVRVSSGVARLVTSLIRTSMSGSTLSRSRMGSGRWGWAARAWRTHSSEAAASFNGEVRGERDMGDDGRTGGRISE